MANLQNVIDALHLAISLLHYDQEEMNLLHEVMSSLRSKQTLMTEREKNLTLEAKTKIPAIKAVKERTGLGLMESKVMVDDYLTLVTGTYKKPLV